MCKIVPNYSVGTESQMRKKSSTDRPAKNKFYGNTYTNQYNAEKLVTPDKPIENCENNNAELTATLIRPQGKHLPHLSITVYRMLQDLILLTYDVLPTKCLYGGTQNTNKSLHNII